MGSHDSNKEYNNKLPTVEDYFKNNIPIELPRNTIYPTSFICPLAATKNLVELDLIIYRLDYLVECANDADSIVQIKNEVTGNYDEYDARELNKDLANCKNMANLLIKQIVLSN